MNLRTLHAQSAAITGRRPWDVMERHYEQQLEDRESVKRDDREEDRQEDMDNARRRHPGDFDVWPSDSQMEYFKRGGK